MLESNGVEAYELVQQMALGFAEGVKPVSCGSHRKHRQELQFLHFGRANKLHRIKKHLCFLTTLNPGPCVEYSKHKEAAFLDTEGSYLSSAGTSGVDRNIPHIFVG